MADPWRPVRKRAPPPWIEDAPAPKVSNTGTGMGKRKGAKAGPGSHIKFGEVAPIPGFTAVFTAVEPNP